MKTNKFSIKKGFIFFSITLLFLIFVGCQKATPFERKNKYDRNLKTGRAFNYSIKTSIVYEDTNPNGLLDFNESMFYKIILTNNGPDPAPFNGEVAFTTNYNGAGLSNNQKADSPSGDVVNQAFLAPGSSTFPFYSSTINGGQQYSFRISNQAIPIPSGTQITVYCHVYDSDDNEVFTGSFIVTLA
jgi:hypothetical protein